MNSNWDRVCYFCHKIFLSPAHLFQHMATHTKETLFFGCFYTQRFKENLKNRSICNKSDNYKKQVKSKFKHLCKFCSKRFDSKYSLNEHIISHTKEKAYQCNICKQRFGYKESIRRHEQQVHDKIRPFPCKECGKPFGTNQQLKKHHIVHSGARDFQCPNCLKFFGQMAHLNRHIKRVHLGEKRKATQIEGWKLVCYFCKNNFLDTYKLEEHMRKHTKERPHYCAICLKGFSYSTALYSHKKTHLSQEEKDTLILKYPCKICQKNFPTASSLQCHILSHTNEKPFSCKICKSGFRTLSGLKSHDTRFHSHNKGVHQKLRPFKCEDCGKAFLTKSELKIHLFTHSKIFGFACPQCPKKYKRKQDLNIHFKVVHLGESHQCQKCTKSFSRKQKLQMHMKKKHK